MINRNYTSLCTCLILLFLIFCSTTAPAASIKDRMLARLPAINELKSKGLIGENNAGYLQYLKAERPQEGLVNAENSDRKTVYEAIAAKQGVKLALVGQRRAKQIADNPIPGHWYQSPDGKWYKK